MDDWEEEVKRTKVTNRFKSRMMLSRETRNGIHITGERVIYIQSSSSVLCLIVLAFCELGPKLLKMEGVKYLLSEVFSQDPLEAYFSKQRHKGGSCDNPTVQQFHYNTVSLAQQGSIYRDLKTMNVKGRSYASKTDCDAPLVKRKKK